MAAGQPSVSNALIHANVMLWFLPHVCCAFLISILLVMRIRLKNGKVTTCTKSDKIVTLAGIALAINL
jgi:hypothetical protein